MQRSPSQVGTIGSTIAGDLSMTIYCDARGTANYCRHCADVDLPALRDRLGADYRIADFVARAVCSKCGARWPKISIRVSPIHTGGLRPVKRP